MALPEDLVEALLRALRDDPRRLAALRALLLEGSGQEPPWDRLARTQEEMGAALRDLARAQVRTEANVAALAERVGQLAEAQRRTEERLEALTARVDSLAARVEDLTVQVGALTARVGGLVGESVERRYRERPFAYLWRIALGLEALPSRELDLLLREVGGPQGLTEEEEAEVRELDAVLKGSRRDDGREVVVAVEASARLDADDVARVLRRSAILARGPFPVVPVVAGEQAPPDVVELARRQGVWVAVDGRTLEPTGAGA